jgi:hypothetical protein
MLAAAQVACMGQQGLSQAGALSPPCPTWGVQQHNMGCSATQHGGFSNTTWGVQQHNMGGSATQHGGFSNTSESEGNTHSTGARRLGTGRDNGWSSGGAMRCCAGRERTQ